MQDKCSADDADRVQYNLTLSPWQQYNFSGVCALRAARCRNSKLVRKRLQPTSALSSQLLRSFFDLHRTVNCGRYFSIVGGRRPPKRGMPHRTGLLPFALICICIAHRPQVAQLSSRGSTEGRLRRDSRISIYSQLV